MSLILTACPMTKRCQRRLLKPITSSKFSWRPAIFHSPKSTRRRSSGMPSANLRFRRKRSTNLSTRRERRTTETRRLTMKETTTTVQGGTAAMRGGRSLAAERRRSPRTANLGDCLNKLNMSKQKCLDFDLRFDPCAQRIKPRTVSVKPIACTPTVNSVAAHKETVRT